MFSKGNVSYSVLHIVTQSATQITVGMSYWTRVNLLVLTWITAIDNRILNCGGSRDDHTTDNRTNLVTFFHWYWFLHEYLSHPNYGSRDC